MYHGLKLIIEIAEQTLRQTDAKKANPEYVRAIRDLIAAAKKLIVYY